MENYIEYTCSTSKFLLYLFIPYRKQGSYLWQLTSQMTQDQLTVTWLHVNEFQCTHLDR